MADINITATQTPAKGLVTRGGGRTPVMIDKVIDFADVLVAKGSALAAADVVQAIDLPKGTVILDAGLEVITAFDDTVLTFDVGTGAEVDTFVDGFDADSGTAAGTYSQNPAAFQPLVCVADDTLDVIIASLTGTLDQGVIRLWAIVQDVTAKGKPGLVQLGS